MPGNKRPGYSTLDKFPRFRVERRIVMPGIIKRPVRFQARSIIKSELLSASPYWLKLHVRGPRREVIGVDPLEARAVPKWQIRGTLPERIIWKYLVEIMHFVPELDFDFQSALQGGRIDTGGIVADFLFKQLRLVINPLGPTHYEFLRMKKDTEQIMALEDLGYQVYMIPEEYVYNEYKFDEIMKKIFGWYHTGAGEDVPDWGDPIREGNTYEKLYASILAIRNLLP